MKRIRRVVIVEPGAPGMNIYSRFPMPRTGPVLLATILVQAGYEARVLVEDVKSFSKDDNLIISADAIGISTTTSTAPRAYKLADYWRRRGKLVIIGGVHASFMDKEALGHADYVIRKEGEVALLELLNCLNGERPQLNEIGNLSYLQDGKLIRNPDRELIKKLDQFPAPDFSLVVGNLKGLILPLITSRGCPFGCNFCSVIKMFGKGYRFKSACNVLEEVKQLFRHKPSSIFIADDNFAADMQRAKKLLRHIIETGLFPWTTQLRTDAAKDAEFVALLAKAGCRRVYIGFESVDKVVLKKMRKGQKLEDIINAIKIFHRYGIQVHGMFIIGTDEEENNAATTIRQFAQQHEIETFQIVLSTPFPGTELYKDMELARRVLSKRWETFDLHHCVIQQLPGKSSPKDIQREAKSAMLGFYSWKYIAWHALRAPFYFYRDLKKGFSCRFALRESVFLAGTGVLARYYLRKEISRN